MKVDVVASEQHYLRHMIPIWAELPDEFRGIVHRLPADGIVTRPAMGHIAMVAGWQDVAPLRGQCQMIYVEHGAGQTYVDRAHDPSYSGSGGDRHRGVIGYICPSQTVADRWNRPSVAVGCPKMDDVILWGRDKPVGDPPVVCFVWHWPCKMSPEADTVWPHYENDFEEVVLRYQAQGFRVVAHEHPKWRGEMEKRMLGYGVDVLPSDIDVFNLADVMIVDNSSLATEFMLLGRPVIFMNAPTYRRDVEHGGRFWDWTLGHPMVDNADELMSLNLWDHVEPDSSHAHAIEITTSKAYAHTDGSSSERAARWIVDLLTDAL